MADQTPSLHHRVTRFAVAAALMLTAGIVGLQSAAPASAWVSPVADAGSGHVTNDELPTMQINGVVWDQTIIGNIAYAVGDFSSARPAGSPLGVNETPKSNIVAYNLTTGAMVAGFTASLNNVGYSLEPSPDGTRLYVGGLFTQVNGVTKYRIAALNPQTGALIPTFNAQADYIIRDIAVTDTTVYVGGAFSSAGGQGRTRLAAYAASNGAVTNWAPTADRDVRAVVLSPDKTKVIIGGAFQLVNGVQARGTAAIDAVTGASLPWAMNSTITTSGESASIFDLSTDGTSIFGNAYHFGGNTTKFEGIFSANPADGSLNWVDDCHGDTYASYPMNGYVYGVTHSHYCGNIGAFPQTENWADNMQHAVSVTADQTGFARRDTWKYISFQGQGSPSMANWFPDWQVGSTTSAGMAGWTVEANSQYLIIGGEFLQVNGRNQQGLVRFAVKPIAPAEDGPRLGGAGFVPQLRSAASGQVRISFPANYDRDNTDLTYAIIRNNVNGSPIFQTTVKSTFWNRPSIGFTDTGLTPGSVQTYRVRTTDSDGNVAWGNNVSITVGATGSPSAYANAVMADGATVHWRLGEAVGTTGVAQDWQRGDNATTTGTITRGEAGAIIGDTDTSFLFNPLARMQPGTVDDYRPVIDTFSIEAWVRTNSNSGGRIIGMSSSATGNSGSNADRHLYMTNNGRIMFGVYQDNTRATIESAAGLNNNQWHHVVGTLGPEGMNLYVDGVRVSTRTDVQVGRNYYGWWRVGADGLNSWGSQPTNTGFSGWIDEPAVYEYKVLTAQQVANHYAASGRTPAIAPVPADAYGAAVQGLNPYLYYRLAEAAGTTANDAGIRANHGDYTGTVARSQSGVLASNAAVAPNGTNGFVASRTQLYNPQGYTLEGWFNTTTTNGGSLISFGNSRTTLSTTVNRQIYMTNTGSLVFRGAQTGDADRIFVDAPFNDGAWHHVVATQGADGMKLYVDGFLRGQNTRKFAQPTSGYWRIGGDTTNGGSTSNYFSGRIDEVAVYETVLTSNQVIQHFGLTDVEAPNVLPIAAFSATTNYLHVDVNAGASTDLDGTIVNYAWNFGDGGTANGVTASHDYALAGNYTITLTVTDNEGGTDVHVENVTATNPPPPNVLPTAAFTHSEDYLEVDVDGSSSTDTDGTIVTYDWSFGDGGTASGATASHIYAAAGTFNVSLTVTDDRGGVNVSVQPVTVTAPPFITYAADSFNRTVNNGLGTANVGGAWTTAGTASNFSVSTGAGRLQMANAGAGISGYLNSVSAKDVDAIIDISLNKAASGTGTYVSMIARRIGTSDYRARVQYMADGTVRLHLTRTLNGTETTLRTVTVAGLTPAPNAVLRLRFQVSGDSTATLNAKVWNASSAEPGAWQNTITDSTAALDAAGAVGVNTYTSGTTTNAPLVLAIDNLSVTTIGAPPANQLPLAAFSFSSTGLQVNVNGGGSTDNDGTIASYAWNFGDGATATGVTASHTYAAAGTYTVTLVVTDNQSGTDDEAQQVTVSTGGVTPIAADAFGRSLGTGLGSADLGGAWTINAGAANYAVGGGAGTIRMSNAGSGPSAFLNGVSAQNVNAVLDIALDKPAVGGSTYISLAARRTGTSDYRARVQYVNDGTVKLILSRTLNGTETSLRTVNLTGLTVAPGTVIRVRFEVVGTTTATLNAKAWLASGSEPAGWQATITDSTAALNTAGGVGIVGYLSSSATNAPVTLTVDNFNVVAV